MVNKGNHPQMALFQVSWNIYFIYPDMEDFGIIHQPHSEIWSKRMSRMCVLSFVSRISSSFQRKSRQQKQIYLVAHPT